ncbi:MAG: hypothetical protein HN600_01890 [Bacteroidetes bacterium]|jgi:hypothetical protein|nr:hypothetical protein [Bacteroidota bacterium]
MGEISHGLNKGKFVESKKSYSKSEIRKLTGCPGYLIDYLNECNRLPVVNESKGKGYPRKYSPKAIDIIKKHIARGSYD